MPNGLHDVPRPGLSFGPYHGGSFADPPQRFPEVLASANERDLEVVLVDVVVLVGESEDFTLVDVIDSDGLEDLHLHEVADPSFGHDRNRNGMFDLFDHRSSSRRRLGL